eukprot:3683958-Pyramimonas_sp.AAC.1
MQFMFWCLNGISDGDQCNLTGLTETWRNPPGPQRLLLALEPFFATAERMIDETVNRSKLGAIQIPPMGPSKLTRRGAMMLHCYGQECISALSAIEMLVFSPDSDAGRR